MDQIQEALDLAVGPAELRERDDDAVSVAGLGFWAADSQLKQQPPWADMEDDTVDSASVSQADTAAIVKEEHEEQCPQVQPYATDDTTEPDEAAPAAPQGAALAVTTTTDDDAVMTYATEVTTVPDDAASAAPQGTASAVTTFTDYDTVSYPTTLKGSHLRRGLGTSVVLATPQGSEDQHMDSSSQHAQQCAPGEAAAQHAMPSQAAPASSRSRAGTKRHVGEHAAARPAKRIRNSHAEDTAQAIAAIERLRRFRAEEAILKRDTG